MITVNKANPTPGEITSSLTGSTGDGAGLHFDGSAGNIDIASPPDLGTAFSFEFVIKADEWGTDAGYFLDFSNGGRFIFGTTSSQSYNISIYDNSAWGNFGVKVLDDLKVHHLVVTVDGTAAVLYDNGNQVGTLTISGSHGIDSCSDLAIGPGGTGTPMTFYRTRFYNKTLTSAEVQTAFERADVDFADQYGSQTIVIPGDFDGNLDGWNSGNTWNSQTNPSNNMVLAASNTNQYCRTAVTLTKGFKYRVTYTASSLTGSPFFAYAQSGSIAAIPATSGSTTITAGTKSAEFTLPDDANPTYFYIASGTASDAVTLDNVSVVRIGCVSDYDLAFANENQSRMVADRSTNNVDGEMSSSGVKQTQVIKQLNSTAMRIGGTSATAATPADGVIIADKLGIGIAPSHAATIYGTGAGNATVQIEGEGGADPTINFLTNNTTHWAVGVDDSDSDKFKVVQHSAISSTNNFFTIDTNGEVIVGDVELNGTYNAQLTDAADGGVSQVVMRQSRGTTASPTNSSTNGDGNYISSQIYNSSAYTTISQIGMVTGSAVNTGRLLFRTSEAGGSLTTRLEIGSTGSATFSGGVTLSGGILSVGGFTELTIASGVVTATSSFHFVDTEGDASSDDLRTVNGGAVGSVLTLACATASRPVTLKDYASGSDNLLLAGDCTLDNTHDTITLIKDGNYWLETSRSNNA